MQCYFVIALVVITCALIYFISKMFRRKQFMEASGRAVFISGCDTGLGNRLAIYFHGLGCDVFAGCLNAESSRKSLPDSVTVVQLDICSEDSVRKAVSIVQKNLREKGTDLWALVNNAGICVYGEFEWQTWNQCQKQVEVNLLGTMRITKAFIPLLRKSRGRIITVTSVNGSIAYPGLSVYSATKFALEGLNHAIRLELHRQHGIRVIIVEPGDFARLTSIMSQHERNADEMWNSMSREDKEEYGDFFRMYHRVTMKNYGLTSPRSFEDSPLLEDMKDALLSFTPHVRYVSAAIQYRFFYLVLASLPFWLTDRILNKITDMLFKLDSDGQARAC